VIADEFIGKSGRSRAIELTFDDEYISGYAAYEGGRLVRVLLINSHAWLSGDVGTRTRTSTWVSLLGTSRKATAKRLDIQFADDASGLKWGGVTYETQNGRPFGHLVEEAVNVVDGISIKGKQKHISWAWTRLF
jgi:hypothetical protein